ncbi:MAG: hypothetical protein JNM17_28320 [Archangium sp.]|nr:hypothetical protein [Archangium sp.]
MIRLERVDLLNPGQYFACCGLFELAHRAETGVTAHFEGTHFVLDTSLELGALAKQVEAASFVELVPSNATSSPQHLGGAFDLRLDWWSDKSLKPWAGTMRGGRIARALRTQLAAALATRRPLDHAQVVLDEEGKKVEPFYFDARRGSNAQARDVGFSTDAIAMESLAVPAVEFLCLVGLQRFRPRVTRRQRVFEYSTWAGALPVSLATVACAGELPAAATSTFRFENAFRTDQRKHKAFSPAVPVTGDDDE